MQPSSDGGGGATPEFTPNARAAVILDRVNRQQWSGDFGETAPQKPIWGPAP
jgi:hypothetical protein